jgi:hypothetical protein
MRLCTCMHVCVCVCVYIYIYIYIYIWMCMYMWIYILWCSAYICVRNLCYIWIHPLCVTAGTIHAILACVYVYMHMHVHLHAHIHLKVHIYIQACTNLCQLHLASLKRNTRLLWLFDMSSGIHRPCLLCSAPDKWVCAHMNVCIYYVCMHVFMYVCVYVYTRLSVQYEQWVIECMSAVWQVIHMYMCIHVECVCIYVPRFNQHIKSIHTHPCVVRTPGRANQKRREEHCSAMWYHTNSSGLVCRSIHSRDTCLTHRQIRVAANCLLFHMYIHVNVCTFMK